MVDLSPVAPAGRQVIESYGAGGFLISGRRWEGSVLVWPGRTEGWDVADAAALDAESFSRMTGDDAPEILLVGCGPSLVMLARPLREALRARGVVADSMDTGAACRTFNVLAGEGREAAAALIALPG